MVSPQRRDRNPNALGNQALTTILRAANPPQTIDDPLTHSSHFETMRVAGGVVVVCGLFGVLAGCNPTMFVQREPWRHDAEEKCLAAGAVKESPSVALLKPIQGPGMCGADFPLKVGALGESALQTASLGYADDLRPPGALPQGQQFPPSNSYPRPSSPVSSQPLPPQRGYAAPSYSSQGYAPPQPMGQPAYRPSAPPQTSYAPPPSGQQLGQPPLSLDAQARGMQGGQNSPEYYPENESISREDEAASETYQRDPYPQQQNGQSRGYPQERSRADAPYTTAPTQSPRLSPSRIPLGPSRAPVATTATVSPAATLACPIVSALDRWIIDAVQPAAQRWFNQQVVEIKQISAYSCRGMNGQAGAHISEHAFGNALDIAAFVLSDGKKITVKDGWKGSAEEQAFLHDVQLAACEQFTTVLAPGSNVYHYDHIHVDLMRRASGRRICQPRAVSGEEVAARVRGKNGPMFAERQEWRTPTTTTSERGPREPMVERESDPFAWRGPSRGGRDTTGAISDKSKNTLRQIIDDEYFLGDEGDEHVSAPPQIAAPQTTAPRLSLPRAMAPAAVDINRPQ
jgi:hypothetical protein